MAMETRLTLRQSQRLVMTPALQQAIQLLQLSTLELQEVIQKEMLENPALEEAPEAEEAPPDEGAPALSVEGAQQERAESLERKVDEGPFDLTQVLFGNDLPERSLVAQEDRDELPFENIARSSPSLADHLDEQLRLATSDPVTRRIGAEIIGNIDADGYLRATVEEIAARCEVTGDEVAKVLELVQRFDPPGVAARTLAECLLIQLRADPQPDPVSVEIVEQHLELLGRRRYAEVARALRLSLDRVMESVEEIMALEPKPGRRFGDADSRYVVPDVAIVKVGDDYVVVLNDEGIPPLRVSPLYRSLLLSPAPDAPPATEALPAGGTAAAPGQRADDDAREYVRQKVRSAFWIMKSVQQRQRTLRRVTESIVKFQRNFLDKGLAHLRPLSLREVGQDVEMHESTISRVTTNKYVETPQGLFELKFFFHSGIASDTGEVKSSIAVKKMIQEYLAAEDPVRPASDQDVARYLRSKGLIIARRTVAKYREELGILPSHQRRLLPRKR